LRESIRLSGRKAIAQRGGSTGICNNRLWSNREATINNKA